MIITGGSLKGRHVSRPRSPLVRPITAKVVEALFDILGPVEGLTVLDAYAGAGTIGIEALSRGASRVIGIERLPEAVRSLKANVKTLGLTERYAIFEDRVEVWLKRPKGLYDLIFADPPYQELRAGVIDRLSGVLKPHGVIVVSQSSLFDPPTLTTVKLITSRRYGDSTLSFYKKA